MEENKMIIYTSIDGQIRIDVRLEDETLWLTQAQMCELYLWGIERSGFFNGREKWAKGFENQRV